MEWIDGKDESKAEKRKGISSPVFWKVLIIVGILLSLLSLVKSCVVTGPPGPQGTPGKAGTTGKAGAAGTSITALVL